jgi:hypothetical protein
MHIFIGVADLCRASVFQSNGGGYNPWGGQRCHIQPHNMSSRLNPKNYNLVLFLPIAFNYTRNCIINS